MVGSACRAGPLLYTRKDFDEYEQRIGRIRFEFRFLTAVHEIGLCFLNLQGFCEPFLQAWAQKPLRPTFSFNFHGRTRTGETDSVTRRTPGFAAPQDTPGTRLWRLCRRHRFGGIAGFLMLVDDGGEEMARYGELSRHMTNATTFGEFVQSLGIKMV